MLYNQSLDPGLQAIARRLSGADLELGADLFQEGRLGLCLAKEKMRGREFLVAKRRMIDYLRWWQGWEKRLKKSRVKVSLDSIVDLAQPEPEIRFDLARLKLLPGRLADLVFKKLARLPLSGAERKYWCEHQAEFVRLRA